MVFVIENQMLTSDIINIWTCFLRSLSTLAALKEKPNKRPTRELPVVCTLYQPGDCGWSNLKPIQMLSIRP